MQSNVVTVTLLLLVLCSFVPATTSPAPGPSIPIPAGNWTMVLSAGLPESSNNWEQLVYIPSIQRSVMLSMYHQTNSEPNESLVGYNFDTNSWDILDMGGMVHTENMPEGGESIGYFDYDSNNGAIVYHCCLSGSNQTENVNHTWWFDVLGQSGRDKRTPTEPPFMSLQPGGAFDPVHNVLVSVGGASNVGTWTYDPVANVWLKQTPGGTPPDPSVILPGVAYSSQAQQIFLFGGRNGSTYYADLYSYNVGTNTWTKISPANGVKPPARYRTNLAYDSTNNIFLLYGGQNATSVMGDTWAYDPVANLWTQLNPPQSPILGSASDFVRMAYDSDHNVFVLSHKGNGGYLGGGWKTLSVQTWLFRYAGTGPDAGTLLNTTQPTAGSLNRNTAGWAKDPTLASSGSSLYVGWVETGSPFDLTNGAWLHPYASQYVGGNWTPLGSTYSSIGNAAVEAHLPSMTVSGGKPWISWYQPGSGSTSNAQVWAGSWNGTTWQPSVIGLVDSTANQGRSQLLDIGGTPYIGFIEISRSTYPQHAYAYLKSWNGSAWSLLGGVLNRTTGTGATATSLSIAGDGASPYAAWTEYVRTFPTAGDVATPSQAYVSHWNGTAWVALGGSLNVSSTSWANDPSIAYFQGQPYVAWTERTQSGNAQLYVAKWNGTSWALTVAGSLNQGGANGWAYHPSLAVDTTGSKLYVAWVEQTALGHKAQVFVSQFTGNAWTLLGGALNVDPVQGSAQRVTLSIYNGQPVAAWSEIILGALRQVYAAQWTGSSWSQLAGSGGARDTLAPSIPAGLSGTPFSSSQINLAWAGSTDTVGVTGYYIYRNGSQVANVSSGITYQDKGLSPNTTYTYNVAAYDAAGNISAKSTSVNAKTLGTGLPSVTITAPVNGAVVSGTIPLSANATGNAGIVGVQFQIDGVNLGAQVTGPGPSYSTTWDTTTATNAPHTVTAIATDTAGNMANNSVTVTVNNTTSGLIISGVSAGSITSSGATIAWTTSAPATSQVAYGATTSYGSTTALDPTLVTAHSVALSGLGASTTYHYQVISQDAMGNTAMSVDGTFATSAPGLQTTMQILGNSSEVSGIVNGSIVTPSTTTAGLTGAVTLNGTGSLNFTPSQNGNGVYFLNCCKNTNQAYYKFVGSTVGSVFQVTQGQVSFTLQSRYSYAQRQATASAPRYTFDVRDGSGNHQFYFLTQVTPAHGLQFNYRAGLNTEQQYYVPPGTEDTLFGNGVLLQVTLSWGPGGTNLYLNGALAKTSSYSVPAVNWGPTSGFDFGAYEFSTFGGYNVSDDAISAFAVSGLTQ